MVDRFETRPFANKIDPHLQMVITSPYVRPQLQHAGLINHRGQIVPYNDCLRSLSPRKRQRREGLTAEIVLRALKIDEEHRRGRHRPFEVASRRAANNDLEILSRRHRKQSHGSDKSRGRSAPVSVLKSENGRERQSRVTSAYTRKLKDNKNLPEPDQEHNRIVRLIKPNLSSAEGNTCEITMSYGSHTIVNNVQSIPDEIIVMQQHNTGENLVIYRGFLIEGESFTFTTQWRPGSALSLAFYAKGFIDSVVNDCCEFKYGRRNQRTNDHSQFSVEQIRNASLCERCRTKYSQRAVSSNINSASTNATPSEYSHKIRRRYSAHTPRLPVANHEEITSEKPNSEPKEHHGNNKHKRHSATVNPFDDNENKDTQVEWQKQITRNRSESIDFRLLELALIHETKSSTQLMQTKSTEPSIISQNSTKHSAEFIPEEKTSPRPSQQNRNIQEWINQTDTRRSSDSTNNVDAGNIDQMFMADSQQHLQKLSHQDLPTDLVRHEKNVENFIYILDDTIKISVKDKTKLRGLINVGLIFNNVTCIEYIHQIVDEQIIMILSRTSIENLDITIHDAPQLRFIYIVDSIKEWSNDFPKIRGIYTSINGVCDQLEKDIILFTHNLTTSLSIAANDTSDSTFAYVQILQDILLESDEKSDLKKEMLDFCRRKYGGNERQLRFIDEFEHHFRSDEAVKWYSRQETFLFKMLTRAFRIPDPDILFKLRFFIQHLHYQLKSNLSTNSMTVYRAQYISNDYFNTIIKNQGGFLAFNQFISANKTGIIPKQQMTEPSFVISDFILVLFQIELDIPIPMMGIGTDPEDILITAATVFRISNVERIDNEIPIVKLTSNNDILQAIQRVTKSVREAACGPFPLLRIAKLMKYMKYMQYAEYFCLILMDDPIIINNETATLVVGGLFHMLCCFYYEQKHYDRALEQLQKSLKVYLRVLPSDDIKLTPTYNNIGSIYHKQGLDEQALHFHMKAYDIQVKSSHPDLDSVAAYAGNIASVLVKQGKYDEAVPYLQRDLQIQQRLYSNDNDIHLSTKYHNLAGAQFKINKYKKALENYRKCLKIELEVHPANHPTVAVTYYNMTTVLESLGQVEEAIKTIEKAIERLLLTRNENDEEIQMYKEYKKDLQQKLCLLVLK